MRPGLWCGHLGACPSYPGWQGQLGAAWCRRSAPVRPAGASWAALPALGSGEVSVGGWWGAAVPGCGETTTFNTNCLFKTDRGTTQSAEQGRAPPTGPQRFGAFACGVTFHFQKGSQAFRGCHTGRSDRRAWPPCGQCLCQPTGGPGALSASGSPLKLRPSLMRSLSKGPPSTRLPPGNARTARTTS